MPRSVKTAVSLPERTYRRAEAQRRKEGKSRSAFYAAALDGLFHGMEVREKEARYEARYREHPETPEELAEVETFSKLSAEALPKEDW